MEENETTLEAANRKIVYLTDACERLRKAHTVAEQEAEAARASTSYATQARNNIARDLASERARFTATLAKIRQYAINAYEETDICRDGLDKFLDEFDMAPYRVVKRVRVTMDVTFVLDLSDPNLRDDDEIREHIIDNLNVDTDDLNGDVGNVDITSIVRSIEATEG